MVFEVNRSSYRYWQGCSRAIDPDRARLEEQVLSVHAASKGSAGARSVAHVMSKAGWSGTAMCKQSPSGTLRGTADHCEGLEGYIRRLKRETSEIEKNFSARIGNTT